MTDQTPEPRCSVCKRPLADWGEHHTIEDCARFEAMSDREKREIEEYIATYRAGGLS